MKEVHRTKLLEHRKRADAFMRAMSFLEPEYFGEELGEVEYAIPLLAVHSAISLSDAVLVGCTGKRSRDQDHSTVLKPLAKLCESRRIDKAGLKHLRWLLKNKTMLAYGDKRLSREKHIQRARYHALQYSDWAYHTFAELVEGETE
jgi:hypothetical protein